MRMRRTEKTAARRVKVAIGDYAFRLRLWNSEGAAERRAIEVVTEARPEYAAPMDLFQDCTRR